MNPTKDTAVFRRDPELAAIENARLRRNSFLHDALILCGNLYFLYSWMLESGYFPDWALISRLFFISAVISFSLHRMTRFSKAKSYFYIAVSDAGIVIEDYYSRAVIEKSRLQAVIPVIPGSLLTARTLSLVIDNRFRSLPDHVLDQQELIRELAERFGLPLIDEAEAVKRGWKMSTAKVVLLILAIICLVLSLIAAITELTRGVTRGTLFFLLFAASTFFMFRFVSAIVTYKGATIKRRNPAIGVLLMPMLIISVLGAFDVVGIIDRLDPEIYTRTPAFDLPASRLAVLDPPPYFEDLLKLSGSAYEQDGTFARAIEDWPAEERVAYERILIEATSDPAMIAAQPEPPPDGIIKVQLSFRRTDESGRRHKLWRNLAPILEREDVILGLVRGLCLCATEIEAAQAEIYPNCVIRIAAAYRCFAADTLRKYQSRNTISRKSAIELMHFVRDLEAVLPTSATLLKTENACWSERLLRDRLLDLDMSKDASHVVCFPDPETPEVRQLRLALFELPLPVLNRFEAGNATFPEILVDLYRCKNTVDYLIESWGYRVVGTLLLPYQLQNLVKRVDFDYDWGKIWIKNIEGRQNLHALGFGAALTSYQAETGSAPASLAQLCNWLNVSAPSVQPPRDLFSGELLNYEVASGPRLFSVGPDGRSGTDDDIVLYP